MLPLLISVAVQQSAAVRVMRLWPNQLFNRSATPSGSAAWYLSRRARRRSVNGSVSGPGTLVVGYLL